MSYKKTISFRVTEEQQQRIAQGASAQGMSISDFARSKTLGGEIVLNNSGITLLGSLTASTSSTPQAVYTALEPRIANLEAEIHKATSFVRED